MKKVFLAVFLSLMSATMFANDSESKNIMHNKEMGYDTKCHFTLKYTTTPIFTEVLPGGRDGRSWVEATVLVDCKMDKDQFVTVKVYFGGKYIGAGNVKIPAGRTSSDVTEIEVSLYGAEEASGYATLKI